MMLTRLLLVTAVLLFSGCAGRPAVDLSDSPPPETTSSAVDAEAPHSRPNALDWAEYVLLGLPRDIVDVPFTGLRRLGFADMDTGPVDDDPASVLTLFAGTGGGIVGGIWLASALGVGFPWSLGVIVPATAVGILMGLNLSFVVGPAGHLVKKYFQNPVLRGGYDSEEFFPHWRYNLHKQECLPPDERYRYRSPF